MWTSPQTAVGPGRRDLDRRGGNMAHRRRFLSARVGLVLGLGLLLGLLLAGRVLVLNQITGMRAEIATLADRKDFLETRTASLQERYNRETSPEVIRRRARSELGLILPEIPDPVLVMLPADQNRGRWTLPGWLEGLTGGSQVQAGELPLAVREDAMVHLRPRDGGRKAPAGSGP